MLPIFKLTRLLDKTYSIRIVRHKIYQNKDVRTEFIGGGICFYIEIIHSFEMQII